VSDWLAAGHTLAELAEQVELERQAASDREQDFGGDDLDDNAKPADEYKPVSILAADAALIEMPPIRSYSLGNPQLDQHLGGGLNTRELATVTGPPGSFKTAFAIAIALYIERNIPVLYASTELEVHELMARAAANILGISFAGIRRGAIPRDRIVAALKGKRIHFIGCERLPRDAEKAMRLIDLEARHLKSLYGMSPAIELDYLQNLASGSERDVRARVGEIANECRVLTQQLDCPMLVVGAVSRLYYNAKKAAELRAADDPTVYLSAAKESGDVEYAAARVLFIDAGDERDRDLPERNARIAIAKSRDATTGFAGVRIVPESGRFLPAPDAVNALSSPGRTERKATDKIVEIDAKVIETVRKMHAADERELCTTTQIKAQCPVASDDVGPSLDRHVHAGRLVLATIVRVEGKRRREREIYDLPPDGGQRP
jgi:hypothetical protein